MTIENIRKDFPALNQQVNGKPLSYLDNAATSQKPQCVIDALSHYYQSNNANVHRGIHTLSERATLAYEGTRKKVQSFINAASEREIIFTGGTTGSINLVASTFAEAFLDEGDEVLVSHLEHHSNIVPWQMVCKKYGAHLRVIPMTIEGELDLSQLDSQLTQKTKLLSIGHISNSLGTINPVRQLIHSAHALNIPVLLDGAQAVSHMPIDIQELDCDFYAFSAHKMFGPTGIGVLYGKEAWLEKLPPWQGGGDMIRSVSFSGTEFNDLPYKFEAGTPHIAGVIGLGAAIDYIGDVGFDIIQQQEKCLLDYGTQGLQQIPGLTIIGTAKEKAAVLSFVIDGVHPHDIGTILDQEGIAIRAGHHCTQPVMDYFGIPATARASLAFYNTTRELDLLFSALQKSIQLLAL